jgi:hypothetical protein
VRGGLSSWNASRFEAVAQASHICLEATEAEWLAFLENANFETPAWLYRGMMFASRHSPSMLDRAMWNAVASIRTRERRVWTARSANSISHAWNCSFVIAKVVSNHRNSRRSASGRSMISPHPSA